MELFYDLRFGLRGLVRRPVHTAVAVVVLALGLAASSTAFSFVNTFYQRIPGSDAGDRLVSILFVDEKGKESNGVSYPDFLDYAAEEEVLDGLAGVVILTAGTLRTAEEGDAATWVWGRSVTSDFFSVLGVEMSAGRSFAAGSDQPGSTPECVLSYPFWHERFAGDPGIVGSTVTIQRQEFLVAGVASAEYRTIFEGFHPDLWMSFGGLAALEPTFGQRLAERGRAAMGILGRLPPGVSYEQAAARLDALAERLRQEYRSGEEPRRVVVRPKLRIVDHFREEMRPLLLAMVVAAGVLLVLAVANVANVFLAVALGRRRELAVRSALGAGRGRLVRLMLAENLVVALAAGGLGLLLTVPAAKWLMWSQFVAGTALLALPAAPVVTLDLLFYAFLVTVVLAAGTASGLVPALGAARRELVPALKDTAQASSAGRRWAARDLMVVVQVALAVVLLVGAGLMLRSFGRASGDEANFASDGLLVGTFSLAAKDMTVEERRLYLRRLEEKIENEPGVSSAVVTRRVPFGMGFSGRLTIEGQDEPEVMELGAARPGFFETLGLPIVAGRSLDERDGAEAPGAVVVNEALARRFFEGEDPLGRRLSLEASGDEPERSFEIVGVVSDVHFGEGKLDWWTFPIVYFSLDQHGHSPKSGGFSPGFGLLVRTEAGLDTAWLHGTLRAHDSELSVMNVVSMPDLLSGQLFEQRANAHYFSVLAVLGLILAAVGLWSVLDVAVRRRVREIGIRMALGARAGDITAVVVGRGLGTVGAGLAVGLVIALALSRLVESLLYGVSATDPWSFLAGAAVLSAVAVAASYLPARRAARVDPLICLREE